MDDQHRGRHVGNPDDPNLDPYSSEAGRDLDPGAVDADPHAPGSAAYTEDAPTAPGTTPAATDPSLGGGDYAAGTGTGTTDRAGVADPDSRPTAPGSSPAAGVDPLTGAALPGATGAADQPYDAAGVTPTLADDSPKSPGPPPGSIPGQDPDTL